MIVRVCVTDVWDTVEIPVTPDSTFVQVKSDSLAKATGRVVDPSQYQIKFRGALVTDENRTLEQLDVPDAAPLIVLAARRRPVR